MALASVDIAAFIIRIRDGMSAQSAHMQFPESWRLVGEELDLALVRLEQSLCKIDDPLLEDIINFCENAESIATDFARSVTRRFEVEKMIATIKGNDLRISQRLDARPLTDVELAMIQTMSNMQILSYLDQDRPAKHDAEDGALAG